MTLRPAVALALAGDMLPLLRPFLIQPVLRGLDLDEPLEYLTEMRQVVIVFVNVVMGSPPLETMIAVVDKCYRITCRLVTAMQGCVNKVTLFDKDLSMLIIFGLRGFKTARESQIALRCAADIHTALSGFQLAHSVAVSVTSGVTYCGVVGHPYRREYTVIGVPVNKAARLMVNYPGIVTCDKDSYLYSKLDTIHFQLQEAKELKGFKRVGPIYEFKERSERRDGSKITLFKWPLLGRQREMTAYASLLTTMAQRRVAQQRLVDMQYANPTAHLKWAKLRKNTLVIGAEPRQGKTRLLNELLSISTELPVYRVSLTQRDAAEPYAGVRQLLLASLPLPPNASRADRQMVLTAALGAVGVARDFMCVMNPVFQVGFPVTINFRKLAPPQRLLAQKLAAERLVVSLFPQLAVVGIDDADFLDRDSWRLLRVIVDLDIVFLILATSTRVVRMSREAQEVLSLRSRVHRIRLGGLDKWYHAGLACQLLDVWAIPPELEKILQTHSRGNPGWIESYLISLVQGGWLRIQMMKRIAVEKAGLVTPPLYMLTRTCQSPDNEAEFLTAAGTRGDRWAMYRPTFADSDVELQRHRVASGVGAGGSAPAAELLAPEQWVAACVRVRPEKLEEPDKSFSVNVLIMQTLDALNPFEQLMLKCGSVIGISFNRKMLLAMMGATTYQRNVSLAVKRLFEIHVLECATRADANMAGGKANASTASVDPSALADNLCDCPVLDFAPDSSDLPHYAHCGFMRFRTPQYCDTTYSLLTESQKLQYHSAAIMYIESNARRCAACGHRYFPPGLVSAELAAAQAGEEGGEEPLDALLSEEPEVELDLEFEGEDDRPYDSDDEAPQGASSSRPSFRRFSASASASASAREPSTVESSFSSDFNPDSSTTVLPSDLSFFSWDNFDEDVDEDEDEDYEEYDEDWSIDDIVNSPKFFEAQRDFQKSMITEQLLINRMQGSYLEETRGSCKRRKARAQTLLARIKKNLRFWDTKGFTNFQNTVRRLLERAKTRRLGRRRPSYFLERRRSRILSSRHDKLQKTTETYSEDFSPFSSLDFRECSCSEILSSTYDSLLRHSMGASMSEKTMDILLHYAELCMELQNQPLALRLLRDAVNLMREQSRLHAAQVAKELAASDEEAPERRQKPEEDPQRQNRIPKYKMPHVYGRIHLLLGESQLAVGKESRAVPELLRALDAFGCPWPRSRAAARMHLPGALLQRSRLLQRLRPPYEAPLLRGFYAVCCVHETRCYCLLYDYFISQGKTELATLAATHAVNRALKVTRGWTSLCGPLSRMLRSWQSAGRWNAARALERTVMRTIRDLSVPSEMGQLRSAGRLLAVVASLRVQRGELAASHGVGTTALAISSATTDNFSRCEMLVLLVDTLTLRGAVEEAAEFLHRLEFFSTEQDAAREDTLWFYALCTFTLVLAGLFMTPLANLVSFVNMQRTRIMREADHGPARRLAVSLWVWCLRREDWAGALVWSRLPAHSAHEHDIRDAITEALRLEGLLLLVVRHLNERNLAAASHVALQVRAVSAALRQSARRLPALRPTLLLLRAYRHRIGGHDARAHALVRRGRVLAARQGNRLCAARCLLSEQAWAGEATDEEMGAWQEHSDGRDPIHWADVVYNGVPLPLPCLPPPTHYVAFRL